MKLSLFTNYAKCYKYRKFRVSGLFRSKVTNFWARGALRLACRFQAAKRVLKTSEFVAI